MFQLKANAVSLRKVMWARSAAQSLAMVCVLLMGGLAPFSLALDLAQKPLFTGQSAKPVVMLAMSRDHELSFKAYPDYSNLSGGYLRQQDTTYRNDFEYYGYFNSKWCYTYAANSSSPGASYFEPATLAVDHKCTGQWSGNFLNWATMTRMDVLRKVLFGGKRAVDTASNGTPAGVTILERAYLPKDSHAFVKVYAGADGAVSDYTPYSVPQISMCNVSTASGATGYPMIRVATGAFWNWDHTEKQQCQWRGTNNVPSTTLSSPAIGSRLNELAAKIKVCVAGKDVTNNIYNPASAATSAAGCYAYEAGIYKPVGILQKKQDSINFGLVSGSWGWDNSSKGGVLRKNAGPLAGLPVTGADTVNEFSLTTGVFNSAVKGIIQNISHFRIAGVSFTETDGDFTYSNTLDWGNPIGEIYAEVLRYLVGTQEPKFSNDDSGTISQLGSVAWDGWTDPVGSQSWCVNCSIIVLSSGPNSNDGNDLVDSYLSTIHSTLRRASLNTQVNAIGTTEFGSAINTFYRGLASGASVSTQCSTASLALSALRGSCPAAPTSNGSYDIAGLAHFARTMDMRSYSGKQTIATYAVELSEGLPSFVIPVGTGRVSVVPICTAGNHNNACSLVGVRVENIVNDAAGNPTSGSYLFYWEDQTGGSDYDMDAVQRVAFCVGAACGGGVNANQIRITNTLPYWATGNSRMHMGFNISGIGTDDGVQSTMWVTRTSYTGHGLLNPNGTPYASSTANNSQWYNSVDGGDPLPANNGTMIYTRTNTYTASTTALASSLTNLRSPLFYAAKYGKFDDINKNDKPDSQDEWDRKGIDGSNGADGLPDNYFVMKNPAQLEAGIINIIENIARESASGAGVSTNSTRLNDGTFVYQALFNTDGWHGEVKAFKAANNSSADFTEVWSTKGKFISASNRNIFSYNPATREGFAFNTGNWAKLSAAQKAALGSSDEVGQNVMNWVVGNNVNGYRSRTMADGTRNLLGDVVNSTPTFASAASEGHDKLPATYGGDSYTAFVTTKAARKGVLYVSANDGMLHAIDADCTTTNVANCGHELFAYVPSPVYEKLPQIAATTYGSSTPHTYLVDGPIAIGDAYLQLPGATERTWRTLLVGAMGAGARGVFVLDITDPENITDKSILFELTATNMPQIGNVMGRPFLAPVAGSWKLVLGNGYNSSDDRAYLLLVDLEDPFGTGKSRAIPTNDSTNNGLAGPTLYRENLTDAIRTAYAGDRLGNMWKFDLSGTVAAAKPAFGSAPNYTPLFAAKSANGDVQPISAAPTLGYKSGANVGGGNAIMVYFGTGSYLNDADVASNQAQSFYGIADNLLTPSAVSGRSSLHAKTMTTTGVSRNVDDSGTNPQKPNWNTQRGWYLDFTAGERIVSKALLAYDRVIFSTLIPFGDGCSFGGSGWLMELVGAGDTSILPLDKSLMNNNGLRLDNFIPGELARLKNAETSVDGTDTLVYSDITGKLMATPLKGGAATGEVGRMSWRQLQ